ncbi:hypothetical protein [Streptomyces tauricus]|uniref:hypothetical protein n=1 Tax=Streptomyces tauricus TaxID=68274 RepID=UPI002244A677|nr:hypothetical protein [Streptomyces tauricus]MCW8103263.1 hypothetical protein [Streptomyces tauricus]
MASSPMGQAIALVFIRERVLELVGVDSSRARFWLPSERGEDFTAETACGRRGTPGSTGALPGHR